MSGSGSTTPTATRRWRLPPGAYTRSATKHPKAPGLYVTTAQPGALGSEELLNALFDGTRDIERTQATVVIADGAVTFERVSEHAWRYSAPVNTELDLADQIVGWAVFERDTWMYSPGVYLPIRSQLGP
jgi:hypothetical protein